MDEQKKTRDLNDVTRELVAARAAGDRDDIDYLAAIKGLFERHPQLLTDADLFKKASDRDEELDRPLVAHRPGSQLAPADVVPRGKADQRQRDYF